MSHADETIDVEAIEDATPNASGALVLVPVGGGELQVSGGWQRVFEAFADSRRGSRGGSPRTLATYRKRVADYFEWAGLQSPEQISPASLSEYRSHLLATTGPATAAQSISAIRAFVRFCRAFSPAMPSSEILAVTFKVPAAPTLKAYQTLTPDEVRRVDEATTDHPRDRAAIALLLGAGLRASEAAGLKVADLADGADGAALLRVLGKGSKVRMVPISPGLVRELLAYLSTTGRKMGGPGPFLLAQDTRAAGGLSARALGFLVARTMKRAGVLGKTISPHSLRHSFALRALRSGLSVVSLSRILGHSSLSTTQRYVSHLELAEMAADVPAPFAA